MKKTMLSIVMMLFCVWGYAQELPEIIPPSPTSYELGKYGDVNVGYFNGTIQPSIPAFEYKTNNLKIPISLSYSSNGIKVDQLATNVGLGWNLNIGGVISRVVRGKPDEDRDTQIPQNIIGNYNSDEAIQYFESYSIGNSDVDTSVDVFNYNFLGKSGKFVLDENKNIVQLEPNGLKIEMINGFTITDELGVKYYFSIYETTANRNYGQGHDLWSLDVKTAWYLSKVSHPKGDEIYFNYASDNYTYDSGKNQYLKILAPSFQSGCTGSISNGISVSQIGTTMSRISGAKKVTEITNNLTSDKIVVSYKANPEVNINNLIQKVGLYNGEGLEIESLNFNYLTTPVNRVFLKEVTLKDTNKKYSFKYISPELLPERLSFSQDHWGYYNGENNSYFFPNPSKMNNVEELLANQNIGADKEVSTVHSQYGILEEITYPTKGKTRFEYENNSYWGTKEIMPNKKGVFLQVNTSILEGSKSVSDDITNVKITQEVPINKSILFDNYNCSGEEEIPHHTKANILVENLTKTQGNIFIQKTTSGNYSLGNSLSISPTDTYDNVYINLEANSTYRITLSVSKPCLSSSLSFSYYEGESTFVDENFLLGGLRVKKQVNISSSAQNETKTFFYGKKEATNQSSGVKGVNPWYISNIIERRICSTEETTGSITCNYKDITYKSITSSSLRNLYNSSTFNTDYRYVTVSYGGDNFEGGGEEYEYIIHQDAGGYLIKGNYIDRHPRDNSGWSNGLLKKKTIFRKDIANFFTIKEAQNFYVRDTSINDIVYGFSIKKNFDLTCTFSSPNVLNIENLDVMESRYKVHWHYLSQTTEKQYDNDGLNPIITTTNYFYDNPNHLQQTRTEVINSKGEVLKTETKYAHDINDTRLINEHRIAEPIEVKTYKGTNLLNHQRTIYDSSHNTSNLYLPNKIQIAKEGQILEDRIIYHTYNDKGNPVEVSKKDGTHIVYIWGYNQTQPIAKIESATLSDISTTIISDIQTKSNADNDRTIGNIGKEGTLRIALNTLRTSLPNAQVTTFTYDPLIGVTSITDPRGQAIYYEYDDFNRLEFVKDADGNLLKEHKYHYKN